MVNSSLSDKPLEQRWLTPRPYPHLDSQPGRRFLLKYVTDVERVSRHGFLPFIRRVAVTTRFKKSSTGGGARQKSLKERPICYAAHLDSHIYAYYAPYLSTLYDADLQRRGLSNCILAYRRLGKSNADFARDAFSDVRSLAPCAAVAIDISKYFDTIDHHLLKRKWAALLGGTSLPSDHYAVFKSLTQFAYIEYADLEYHVRKYSQRRDSNKQLFDHHTLHTQYRKKGLIAKNREAWGIPQGSPISAVLSNIYLVDYDIQMKSLAEALRGTYRRYCDDILFVVPVQHRDFVKRAALDGLRANRLSANLDKVETSVFSVPQSGVVTADRPLQYLGFTFDGKTVLLRGSTLAKYFRRVREGARALAAFCAGASGTAPVPLWGFYERYTHLGHRNFFSYAKTSSKKLGDTAPSRPLK